MRAAAGQLDVDLEVVDCARSAAGALEAARAAGRASGKDLFPGGIDLGYEALVAICDGSLTVSIGATSWTARGRFSSWTTTTAAGTSSRGA